MAGRLPIKGLPGIQTPQSPNAVASVGDEQTYYQLLDARCEYFKYVPGGEGCRLVCSHLFGPSEAQAMDFGHRNAKVSLCAKD